MPKKYDNIQQLISYWQQFEETTGSSSFGEFCDWLSSSLNENRKSGHGKSVQHANKSGEVVKKNSDLSPHQQFMMLLSRLAKYQEFYIKRFFEGLPVNTLTEFNFLFSLNKNEALKKTDIIQLNLVEYTTGIDILKRLIRMNLVKEFRDELDKRNKRIKITSEGKRVLIEALLRINKLFEVFLGCVDHEQWQPVLPFLSEIDEFHNYVFTEHADKSYFELIHLIESQKNKVVTSSSK